MENLYLNYKNILSDINMEYLRYNKVDIEFLSSFKDQMLSYHFLDLYIQCINILCNYYLKIANYQFFNILHTELNTFSEENEGYSRVCCVLLEGIYYWYYGQKYDKSLECFLKAKDLLTTFQNLDKQIEYRLLHLIGVVYCSKNDFLKAYKFLNMAINFKLKESDGFLKAQTYGWLAILESSYGNREKAIEYNIKCAEILKHYKIFTSYSDVLNSIGLLYLDLEKNDFAFESFNESLSIALKYDLVDIIADAYNNIGLVYKEINDYEKAEEHYFNSIEVRKKTNNLMKLSFTKTNLGNLYLDESEFIKAREYFYKSLEIALKIDNKAFLVTLYCHIADLYLRQSDLKNAFKNIKKAEKISLEYFDKNVKENIYHMFSIYYEQKKQYKNALKYYKMTEQIKQEIKTHETEIRLDILHAKNEIDKVKSEYEIKIKKEKQIAALAMAVTANHEINQPLTILQTSVDILMQESELETFTDKQKKYLFKIEEAVEKIDKILLKFRTQNNLRFDDYLGEGVKMVKYD